MKFRVTAVALGAAAAALLAASPAAAQTTASKYDHKDPYKSGCAGSSWVVKTGKIKSRANGTVGTIQLWWSAKCKTNWVRVKVPTNAWGSINVYSNKKYDRFVFKKGNGGTHWGNMIEANNVCAWGGAAIQWGNGRGGQNGQGSTAKACR
ncbi:DUF2690 domain-containing protein [Nonomuraea rhizosphaerae]|uniref:DUF2690 domain-containing protein n=1 Tax=Nonomuraea rhizosphaerae TaxID=2665663 RepID=UPI001C5D213F|nr:DUF2690 domain-containing protein [Nonomuraea rhizosphaerae]